MVSGHIGGFVTSLVLFFGASGAAFYLLRQNFRKGETGSLPKAKAKPKAKPKTAVAAVAAVSSTPPAVLNTEVSAEPSVVPSAVLSAVPSAPEAAPPELPTLNATPASNDVPTRSYIVTSVHVAIWPYDRVLENLNPDHAVDALNEFHSIGKSWAEKNHVIYERSSGGSFYLHATDPLAAPHALKCALELRQEFMEWNDVRKAQAYAPFIVVMGADRGAAIWGQIGAESHRQESIVGEVIARARALSQIALSLGSSLLASEELWTTVSDRYLGEKVARANLTAFDNLTSCYKVKGHIAESGQEIWAKEFDTRLAQEKGQIDAPRIESKEVESNRAVESPAPVSLWRVNNGSQILGPMSEREVALALYSLEIDFDCECWKEGAADRVLIEKSGMFGAAIDPSAFYWVFDGETIHGPLSQLDLNTEQARKQYPRDSYVCEKSTVLGWKPLMELRASWLASESVLESAPEVTPAQGSVFEATPSVLALDPVIAAPALVSEPAFEPVLSAESAPAFEPAPTPEPTPALALTPLHPDPEPVEEPEIEIQTLVSPPALALVPEPAAEKETEAKAEQPPAPPIDLPILMPVLEVAERPGKKSA